MRAYFRDPATRPRAVIWSGITVLTIAAFAVAVAVIATSTRMFCAESCHHVQDDAIAAYKASAHANISCIACHEPANATPLQFAQAKLTNMGELPPAIMRTFSFPLNKGSAYALNTKEMGDRQCTQCHTSVRKITPSAGIKIDHAVHKKNGVTCTSCHNRAGHDESGLTLKLKGNEKHADFLKMNGCFRCHGQEAKHDAPGTCPTCHPADFELVPASHESALWLAGGHSDAAAESLKEYGAATVESEELLKEGVPERLARPVEYCSTCHKKAFCEECHSKLAAGLKKS